MGGVIALLFRQRSHTRAVFCDDILPRPLSALHAANSLFLSLYVFFECAYQNFEAIIVDDTAAKTTEGSQNVCVSRRDKFERGRWYFGIGIQIKVYGGGRGLVGGALQGRLIAPLKAMLLHRLYPLNLASVRHNALYYSLKYCTS
jgi:hypothetical protein